MKRLLLLCPLLFCGCNYISGQSWVPHSQESRTFTEAPPGSGDESTPEPFDRLIARADGLQARRRPIEALRMYREALAGAPANLPVATREKLEGRISQLSFVLGVPRSETEEPPPPAAAPQEVDASRADAASRARALYTQAQEAEHSGKTVEALGLYRQVLKAVKEQDDPALYWNVWQKVEDLVPDGEGPAAAQEKQDLVEAALEAKQEKMGLGDDGSVLPAAPVTTPDGVRAADVALGQARAAYIKGMGYARAKETPLARQAFQQVLSSIRESQDPELYRAARQNMEDLKDSGKMEGGEGSSSLQKQLNSEGIPGGEGQRYNELPPFPGGDGL